MFSADHSLGLDPFDPTLAVSSVAEVILYNAETSKALEISLWVLFHTLIIYISY